MRTQLEKFGVLLGLIDMVGSGLGPVGVISDMSPIVGKSDHDDMPMALLEAIAVSVPRIARAIGEILAVLEHDNQSSLVSDDRPEACAGDTKWTPVHPRSEARGQRPRLPQAFGILDSAKRYLQLYAPALNLGATRHEAT